MLLVLAPLVLMKNRVCSHPEKLAARYAVLYVT
jgi:hypothetical protein